MKKLMGLIACVAGLTVLTPAAGAVAATGPAGAADPTQVCVDTAAELGSTSWSCMGSTFYDTSPGADQAPVNMPGATTTRVAGDGNQVRIPSDPDDTVCENVSTCFIRTSDFISTVKGNAAYGDSTGAIGSFDVILKVNLNGRSPRYEMKFIQDTGPALTIETPQVQCTDTNGSNPFDSDCGLTVGNGFTIGPDPFDTGTTGLIDTPPLADEGPYFGTLFARFTPAGFAPMTIATLDSEQWFCPTDGICSFNF